MKISILISTIDSGILDVKSIRLNERKDVEYVISHQYTDLTYKNIPYALLRNDTTISQIPGKGLSKSRNNAIKHASGDIAIIADDDVRYKPEYFEKVIEIYRDNDIDVACFKIKTPDGEPEYKKYPNEQLKVNDFDEYSPSSIELTFRLEKIKSHSISFDHRFGLGSNFIGGEEKLFLYDSIEKCLRVKYIPEYIVEHPFESSNKNLKSNDWQMVRKRYAYECRLHGFITLARAVFGTIKNYSKIRKTYNHPILYSYHRISSIMYILLTSKNK